MTCDEHWGRDAGEILGYTVNARYLFWCCVFVAVCLLMTSLPAHAMRDDVLVIVNDNSVDSPQVGAYYAQQRDINPANIVHINVPDSYFISWDDFRRLRDQLIRFMQLNTLDEPALTPAVCNDGEPPYYCSASMDQLRAHTQIRYLVTTRGVPTRMTVDGSTLSFSSAPTSVDNYLKYWLINYFTDDVQLKFSQREIAFGDGRGMRPVQPTTDRELIVGRIDGLNLNAAMALVDRTLTVEGAGIYGSWYGSTQFWSWRDASVGRTIYPKSGSSLLGWRYTLGLWGEDRAECADYLNFFGMLPVGKTPAHCRVKLNDDANVSQQTTQGINYPAPGNSRSRQPQVVDALGYQGWVDGQAAVGSFNALLNWRKNDQCTLTLCDNAADPAACRANSSDIFAELNTDCVGVADGFMAYNHQSWPLSYFTLWPTGWTGASGGDKNKLAFPEVRTDIGFDDAFSLWFRNTDQVTDPRCYSSSDFSLPANISCPDTRQLQLRQSIALGNTSFDANNPATYQISLQYQGINISQATPLRVQLLVHETGAGSTLINYGFKTLATLVSGNTGWTSAAVQFVLDPLLHNGTSYDRIELVFDTPATFSGDLGIDAVSVQVLGSAVEMAINGSFADGFRQVATGDHAANFLSRFGGVAVWGSVGHHQSGGCAFCFNGLETMIYFLRGLPLGDAVWFNESNNSGMLYGDPLYSPVAVRLNPVNSEDLLSNSTLAVRLPVNLFGSTVNGRNPAQVNTSYRIDICPGDDFHTCDRGQSWLSTGISGQGGSENTLLGSLDTTLLAAGQHTLRLQVTSLNITSGRSQTINDYYVAAVNDSPVAFDGNIRTLINVNGRGFLTASDVDNGTLRYSIVSNASKGLVLLSSTTGAYQYRPNPGITGVDSFTFKVNDGTVDSNIATITVSITATNDPPVANAGTLSTSEDVAANGNLTATDIDGDALTYSIAGNGTKGTAIIINAATGAYSYTPNANATGTDSFTFKANDGLADSNIAIVSVAISAVNDVPLAQAGTLNTNEDIAANGVLSASDVDADSLSYSLVSNGVKGTVVITNATTGAYSYTPNPNATGNDSFSFKVNDGLLDSNIATVSVNITAVNDAPVAQAGTLNATEDIAANGVLNASDVDNGSLSYSIVSNGLKGRVLITNAVTGAYSYTPDLNTNGSDSFTFKANDGIVDSNIATITVNITATNDPPVANAGTLTISEDVAANGNLTATDIDGDALTYSIAGNGTKGTAIIINAATGAYSYTPNANATGTDSFTFKANDGLADSNIAIVSVTISAVNDVPLAQAGTFNATEDIAANGILSASDVDGDSLSYSIVSNGLKGRVLITNAATGAYSYTPNPNATGNDSFSFKVNDGLLDSNIATVSVNITAVNDAPVAQAGTLNATEDVVVNGVLSASDIDGDSVSYSLVSNGAKGSVTLINVATGAYSYTPNPNSNGVDSFTFQAGDGLLASSIATVTVNITAVNDVPLVSDSVLNINEDTAATGLLGATDVDSDPLIYSIITNASQGVVALTNISTGAYTYTPNANATGNDSFSFKVNDGLLDSIIATVNVSIAPVNDAPVALAGTLNATEDIAANGVLNASDVDNGSLSYSIVSNGLKGRVLITNAATGAYIYTPDPNANGTDSFTFKANDGPADSNIAIVSVSISAINDPPLVTNANLSTIEDSIAFGSFNALDLDGDGLIYSIVSNGSRGTVTIINERTGAFIYVPDANVTGNDGFSFKVNDGLLDSNIATVSVNITAVNDAPVVQAGTLNATEDVVANGVLSASDIDGDSVSYSLVSNGSKGSVTLINTATGAYSYTPNPNANGVDSFTFQARDLLASSIATVTVNIAAVNDAPIAVTGIKLNSIEDTVANGVLNAIDMDGDTLIYSIVNNGSKGVVTITNISAGSYTYTPNADAIGADSFTFKVNDSLAVSNIATVTVNILTEGNEAPLASNSVLNIDEDAVTTGLLDAADEDRDPLVYSIITQASQGVVVLTNISTGRFTYTPNANATGTDSFAFMANDGLLDSNLATVTVNIAPVNDVPVATSVSFSTINSVPVGNSLDASDDDGDPLIFSLVENASNGTVVITNDSTGEYTYTPNPGATGSDSFTFKVNDSQVDSDIATVKIQLLEVTSAAGSLNSLFILLLSLLSGLRFIPVGRVLNRNAGGCA